MPQLVVKAGATFSASGLVEDLTSGAWTAAATVRNAAGAQIAALAVTMAEAIDYATSGDWVIMLGAAAGVTATWLTPVTPFDRVTLYCDVAFTNGGTGQVVFSETVAILVEAPVTGAWG